MTREDGDNAEDTITAIFIFVLAVMGVAGLVFALVTAHP